MSPGIDEQNEKVDLKVFDYKFDKSDKQYTSGIIHKISLFIILIVIFPIFLSIVEIFVIGMPIQLTFTIYIIALLVIMGNTAYNKFKFIFAKKDNAVQITANDYPRLFKIVEKACDKLSLGYPPIYISNDYEIEAVTFPVKNNYFVLINSACLDLLNDDELLFVIGHELSHLKYSDIHRFPTAQIMSVLNPWYLEYLADFGGYEVNGNLDSCKSALAKLGAGNTIIKSLTASNLDTIFTRGDRKVSLFSKICLSHPPVFARLIQLQKYANKQEELEDAIPARTG